MYGKRRARIPIIGFRNTIPFFLRTLVVKCGQRGAAVERIGCDRRHRLMNDDPRDIRAFLKICVADRCDRGGNADDPLDRLRNEHDTRKIAVADDSARIFIIRVSTLSSAVQPAKQVLPRLLRFSPNDTFFRLVQSAKVSPPSDSNAAGKTTLSRLAQFANA